MLNIYRQRLKTLEERFWEKVSKTGPIQPHMSTPCWEWQATLQDGRYGSIRVSGSMRPAHRVSWELTKGPIRKNMHILHKCDNTRCVRPSHLFQGTAKMNMRDAARKGRLSSGRPPATAKINMDIAAKIRITHAEQKLTQRQLASMFSLSQSQIGNVLRNISWSIK